MRAVAVTTVALAMVAVVGCKAKQSPALLYPPVPGRTPTLVFDSLTMTEIRAERPVSEVGAAWYEDRLDGGPVAFRGFESPQLQAKSVYTWDQQLLIDGQVHTHFRQTTRRIELQESVR